MKLFRKLTKREWKEIGEKYKDGGVHMYRGKLTYFYNGELLACNEAGDFLVCDWKDCEVIIVLPGVEVIPERTFSCWNVKTVIMADTVKRIEDQAFNGCKSLVYVKLSKNIEYIGEYAFMYCKSLVSIFIPESCTQIGDGAFYGCKKLIIFNIPQHTELGKDVISKTTPLSQVTYNSRYPLNRTLIRSRHDKFPLHKLCCSEDPKFNKKTIIPTKQECLIQDDFLGFTPLMYLIANHTAEFDTIEKMIKIGGKELLFIEDKKGINPLHCAFDLEDEAMIRLLVRKGGRELVDTLNFARPRATHSMIKSALLLHDYIYAVENTNRKDNLDEMDDMIDTLLESKPSFREINEIMGIEGIPDKHRQKFHKYNRSLLDQELKSFQETQEKVSLMRSTITVVGRGQDGKTSTINSLKGLPFQPYCESTKGTQTSEVDVHEIGIHVTNVEATSPDVAFNETERDPFSTIRSMESHLMKSDGERWRYDNAVENATPNQSGSVDAITKRLARQTLKSKVYIKKESRLEEDIAKKADDSSSIFRTQTCFSSEIPCIMRSNPSHEEDDFEDSFSSTREIYNENIVDIDLATGKDDKAVRFTIYDNGGQKVFRSIQNLLLSREGIFIVVFDMMKICNGSFGDRYEALEHLIYWLSSIKEDACEADSDEYTDPSIKYPPVILVGTHFDEFLKLKGDPTEGLKALNKILVDSLHLSDLVPLPCQSNDFVPLGRQQLYNEAQDLCFWPVNNSNPKDPNIQAIRKILLEAAINDPGFDITQEVPISFLKAMDKLTAISEEVPILPIINRNDPKKYSVMYVMNECGVFRNGVYDGQQKLEICKAILKQYQSLGHFIYFHQVGLEDYCILDPQWLINMITYIVRDFKLHRFRRDFNAMALNNGESWKSLLSKGILDGALLRKLWLDREHEQFLSKLMLELGIFGNLLGDVEDLSNTKFTVPIAVTICSDESREYSLPALIEYLGVKSIDDTTKECINMSSCPFNLVPFYSRLVNRLISEWYSGYSIDKNLPELLPCAANLCLGENYKFSILINEKGSTLDIFVSDHKKMNIILKHILEACSFVNAKVYQSRLNLVFPAVNVGNEVILCDTIHVATSFEAFFCDAIPAVNLTNEVIFRNATDATEIEKEEEKHNPSLKPVEESSPAPAITISTEADIQEIEICHPNLQALIDVFQNEKLARKIHEKDEDVTPEELIQMYYSDEDTFVKDVLPELGIMQKLERFRLIKILKSKPKPLEDELYAVFNFLDGNHLAVKSEEEAIRKSIRISSYFSFAYKVLRGDEIYVKLHKELVAHQEYKVVHFGMHGSSIDTFVTTTLASRLEKSSVKCMVLNMCKSKHIAKDLRDKAKIEQLVYWLSDLEDNAAKAFSEAFYYYLCLDKKANYLEFKAAFDFAKESLRLRDYLLIDPANKEKLEQKKRAQRNPTLKAAGVPVFDDRSQEQQEDLTLAVKRIVPVSPPHASRNANSSTSTAATQQDMDVDGTNASEQENPRNWREEPSPSSNSTPMASREPYNQNSFSQSDIHSSKKRRRDENVVQKHSDDSSPETAVMNLFQESPRVPNQKEQKQNKPSQSMRFYQSENCQLTCRYIFSCDHAIVSNCQYIKYKNQTERGNREEKFLTDGKEFKVKQKCRSKTLTKCEECGIYYCSEKKVPSEGSSVVDKSCYDVHVCTSDLKAKPDITIRINHRKCNECTVQAIDSVDLSINSSFDWDDNKN